MTEDQLISYGRKIQSFRTQAGLTQDEACLLIGVSKTSLRNWEKGRKLPTASNFDRLVQVYGIKGDDLHYIDTLVLMTRNELIKKLAETVEPQGVQDE